MHSYQGRRSVFCIGGGGGRANKQVPETLACRGFWGISPPEKFEILKLENATFSILDEISKKKKNTWIIRKMIDVLLFICYVIHI